MNKIVLNAFEYISIRVGSEKEWNYQDERVMGKQEEGVRQRNALFKQALSEQTRDYY